jgi:hypothetical protein
MGQSRTGHPRHHRITVETFLSRWNALIGVPRDLTGVVSQGKKVGRPPLRERDQAQPNLGQISRFTRQP